MMPRTPARMIAEAMEEEQVSPLAKRLRQMRGMKVDTEGGMGPLRRAVQGATGAVAPGIEAIERMTSRPRRTEDEMSELTREIGRGMASGGMLKDVDSEANPGLAKLPEEVRNKMGYKRSGGKVGYASGGKVGSASKRADGIAQRGKTRGRII